MCPVKCSSKDGREWAVDKEGGRCACLYGVGGALGGVVH